jgi:DNA-binding transcriptional ArsR family regulator
MRNIPRLKAEFFKALGHPVRIRVLELLAERERSVTGLLEEIDVEQPYLSQQLAVLRRGGFVDTRREATGVVYAHADARIKDLLTLARTILLDMLTETRNELHAS